MEIPLYLLQMTYNFIIKTKMEGSRSENICVSGSFDPITNGHLTLLKGHLSYATS